MTQNVLHNEQNKPAEKKKIFGRRDPLFDMVCPQAFPRLDDTWIICVTATNSQTEERRSQKLSQGQIIGILVVMEIPVNLDIHVLCGGHGWLNAYRIFIYKVDLSHVMRKPVYAICEQHRRRSACASAQSDHLLCCTLPGQYNTSSSYSRNFKTLASLIS